MSKLPDSIVYNNGTNKFDANIKEYPTSVSAPKFAPINIDKSDSLKADKYFDSRLNEIKSEYENLVDEYKWNNIIYNSLYNFQPLLGEAYHLYLNKHNEHFLSLIKPNEWTQIYIGTFILLNNGKWKKESS
ncbi:DUF2452 domain-containing protein [Flavobacteriaceae bacterium]|nr:DUF2452 domain-containing protein [Flavobacteriaceae bacterium]